MKPVYRHLLIGAAPEKHGLRYRINDVISISANGQLAAHVRLTRKFLNNCGARMLEAAVIDLPPDYQGELKVGARVTFPEAGVNESGAQEKAA